MSFYKLVSLFVLTNENLKGFSCVFVSLLLILAWFLLFYARFKQLNAIIVFSFLLVLEIPSFHLILNYI